MRTPKNGTSVRKELRSRRIIKNLSQKELADLAHIAPSYYSLIESGKAEPSNSVLKEICKVLEIEDWRSLISK